MIRVESRLAWRNLGRNRRRTALTVSAMAMYIALVVIMNSFAGGAHTQVLRTGARMAAGHLTLMAPGHLEERTLESPLRWNETMRQALETTPGIEAFSPRLNSFALISHDDTTRGMLVRGIDPSSEVEFSEMDNWVVKGRFLDSDGPREILLGRLAAQSLEVEPGDEVLMYGVAYSLESAYELFTVVGTMTGPDKQVERSLAVISLQDAKEFYVYDDNISEVAILLSDSEQLEDIQGLLERDLSNSGAKVHTYREVMPELEQLSKLDLYGMYGLEGILIIVVGFGLLNTILMAVLERKREFGVVLALGLRPGQIFRLVYLEAFLLAILGIGIGLLVALPVVLYIQANPIPLPQEAQELAKIAIAAPTHIPVKFDASIPIVSALIMLGVALLAALYPARKASRGQPIDVVQNV